MKFATVTLAYHEPRFIKPHLEHIPDWVDEKLVLVSTKPWQGEPETEEDTTATIARSLGATVIEYDWASETDQRNAGQEFLSDYDWIIVLDPDEFLDKEGWAIIHRKLGLQIKNKGKGLWKYYYAQSPVIEEEAFVIEKQRVFWKDKEVSPHTDYQQIILVKPSVRFLENRVVDKPYGTLPVTLYHFSWARTDKEVWRKVSHYSHANEMDIRKWYEEIWLADKQENLHPKTPETLQALIDPILPKEIKELNLWP